MSEEDQNTTEEAVVHVDTKKTKRKLRVALTNDELLEAGDILATKQQELNELNDELKGIKDTYKAKTSAIEAEQVRVGNLLRQKYEMRDVEVEITCDYDAGIITIVRLDSGDVVESRAMNDAEKQREMELWPQGDTPSNDGNTELPVSHVEVHDAIRILQETKRASVTALQRRMGLSERRAWMVIDKLEDLKVVGPPVGEGEPREILMDETTLQRFLEDYPEAAEKKSEETTDGEE